MHVSLSGNHGFVFGLGALATVCRRALVRRFCGIDDQKKRSSLLALWVLGTAVACAGVESGASDASLALAEDRAAEGARLYAQSCAECHGDRGQGHANVPKVIGPGALRVFPRDQSKSQFVDPSLLQQQARNQVPGKASRQPFHTAKDVFDYVSTRMPLPVSRAGSLRQEEYWAILNFMLVAHGVTAPEGGVNQGNAAALALREE